MPLYEYKCGSCGQTFEVIQRFSDDPLKTHEGCGGEVARLISSPALQFKGSGWYITDYARSGGSEKKNGSSSTDTAKTETKTESKSESKSESKPSTTTESK